MNIRQATHKDAKEISALLSTAFKEFRSLYTNGGFHATVLKPDAVKKRMDEGVTWVVDHEGVVGTVSVKAYPEGLYICGMAVHPSHRNLGLGSMLLDTTERYALDNRFTRIFLSTTPFLTQAIALYKAFGFKKVKRAPFDLKGTPLIAMEKKLRFK